MCAPALQARPIRPGNPLAFTGTGCPAKGTASCKGRCGADLAGSAPAEARQAGGRLPIAVSKEFVADILSPYKAHARYLKSASITGFRDKASGDDNSALVAATGQFSIPESCYIEDTGHFNAVEFNICFNQLAYVMFGKCVAEGLMGRLRFERVEVPTFSEFKRLQLPNMVIVNIESRYYRQLDSRSFTGTLRLERVSPVGGAWFFFTSMTFADREGVKAKGSVVLAFSPSFTPLAH